MSFSGNVTKILGGVIPTPNVTGEPLVDLNHIKGGVVPAPNVTGEPLVDVNHIAGAALGSHAAGQFPADVRTITASVTVTTNNDKTGYTASTVSDKTGYSLVAGGYSIRASNIQRGTTAGINATTTNTTVSSVTTTRAYENTSWDESNNSNGSADTTLNSSTNLASHVQNSSTSTIVSWVLREDY